jgi:hypothetical protein
MANQFLIKDTVAAMRDLPSNEIINLQNGTYRGVKLLGYYEKEDTPSPIDYYISNTTEEDNGGSIIAVSNLKLEHKFISSVDTSYFGCQNSEDFTTRLQYLLNNYQEVRLANHIHYVNSTIFLPSETSLKGAGDLSVIKATVDGDFSIEDAIIAVFDCEKSSLIKFKIDQNGVERSNRISHSVFLANCDNVSLDRITFVNNGSATKCVTGGVLFLQAKDTEDMLPKGRVGAVTNCKFNKCSIIQNSTAKCNFAIRVHTNWSDEIPTENFVHKVEGNIFNELIIKGDYAWDIVEFAGGGTVSNTIQNCYITGRTTTGIDFDKGCSYNLAHNNTIENLEIHPNSETIVTGGFIFSAIADKGNLNGYSNNSNKITNNRIINCGLMNFHDTRDCLLYLRFSTSSLVLNNTCINSTFTGMTLMDNIHNCVIENNHIVTSGRGIINNSNPNSGNISNIRILNNNFSFGLSGINFVCENVINPVTDIVIENNTIEVQNSWCVFGNANTSNFLIKGNVLTRANGEKVSISTNKFNFTDNIIRGGSSTYNLRFGYSGSVQNNVLQGTGAAVINQNAAKPYYYNNSWSSNYPFYRSDAAILTSQANDQPTQDFFENMGIRLTTVSSGNGYPSTQGLVASFVKGTNDAGGWLRSFDIFKTYNKDKWYFRGYNSNGMPREFIDIQPQATSTVKGLVNQASSSLDSASSPSTSYSQAEMQAILNELRDLKTKLRSAGLLEL